VQGEGILQAVRPLRRCRNAADPEPKTVAFIEPVRAPIEGEQILQRMIRDLLGHILSLQDK
jgi:hypothetical protein